MTFVYGPRIMSDDLNGNIFTPNLWFSTDFDQTYIEEDVDMIECIKNVDNIDRMTDNERMKMFSKIMDHNHEKHSTNDEKMMLNQEKMRKIMKFIHHNYDFEKAKKQLIKCMAFIKISRDFIHSNVDNRFTRSAMVSDFYFKNNNYPFRWMSSNSLYSNYYPVVYKVTCLREHCVLLAWRVVFICLKKVMETIDFTANLSKYIGNSDSKICDLSNQKRYANIKKYLFLSFILLNQVIPAQMTQLSGNLKNHSKTTGALIMPELNPHVVETYSRIVMMLIQHCFFVQSLSYFTSKVIASSSDVSLKCMLFFLNQRNYDLLKSDDETENMDMTQKNIYTESVDVFISMCADNNEIIGMLCGMFQLSYVSMNEMIDRVWKYNLNMPFNDVINNRDKEDMLPSKDSIFFSEKIKRHFKSKKAGKKEKMMVNMFRRTLLATNCKNFLLGKCIYIECLLSCYEISKMPLESGFVVPHIVNLCNKVELLFLPQFDMKLCAFEIMAWILNTLNIRKMLCGTVERYMSKEDNKPQLEIGMRYSYLWRFVKKESSTPISSVKKFMSSIFTTNASNGKKIASSSIKSAINDIKHKKKDGSEEDENDIFDDDSGVYDMKTVNMPFSYDDLIIWSIMIGYYPYINNSKSNIFPQIQLHSFSKHPSYVFIPKGHGDDGFCKEYQEMLMSISKAVYEKSCFIKGKKD